MYLIFKYASFAAASVVCLCACILRARSGKAVPGDTAVQSKEGSLFYRICEWAVRFADRWWLLLLFLLFGVFCFTRFYVLDMIPAGIHYDEIGYWYDAHNLAVYGTDRMGSRYPVLPASYGDGHNPLYCYMCMVLLKFFPFSVKLMRAVMGISAIPCFFASFGIIYRMYESRRWALLGPVFVTITPYIFAANRWGLNANQMLYVCTVMLYFLVKALKYGRLRDYILSGVFFGISLLTYHLSYIMMPLFFVLFFIYLIMVKQFKWKNAMGAFIPFAVIGMPTFIEQLVNLGIVRPFYFLGSDYPRLTSYRVGEIAPVNLINNIGNIVTLVFGDENFSYNSVKEFGTLYWSMIPLVFTGMIIAAVSLFRSVKRRSPELLAPFFLYGLSIYIGFISVIGCNAYKGNAIYICFIVFAIAALRYMAGCKAGSRVFITIMLCLLAFSFLLYTEFYFRRLNAEYGFQSLFTSTEPGDMLKYEEAVYNPDGSRPVYMELDYGDRGFHSWLIALYLSIPYEEFNEYDFEATRLKFDGVSEDEINRTVPLTHFWFAFPEEFDENEDAVYILGNNWNHISAYLISIGFECDTTFPNYKILYRR